MKAPNKIYLAAVEPRLNGYAGIAWADAKDIIEPIEYIRKDALMDWLGEQLTASYNSMDIRSNLAYSKVVDKIKSL